MAGSKTDYMENLILNYLTGRAALSQLTLYMALYTVPPTDAGGGTEVTGGSYARKQLNTPPSTNPYFGSASANGQIANTADITFPTPTADWGNVTAVGVLDAASAGNLLLWSVIPVKQIKSGDSVVFPAGSVVLSED